MCTRSQSFSVVMEETITRIRNSGMTDKQKEEVIDAVLDKYNNRTSI